MTTATRPEAQARWTVDDASGLGTLVTPFNWDAADQRAVYRQLESLGWSVIDVDHLFRPSPDNPVEVRLLSRMVTADQEATAA